MTLRIVYPFRVVVNLKVCEYNCNASFYIAMKDRHLKKLKSMEKLLPLKNERREKNPIKLESAKKLTRLPLGLVLVFSLESLRLARIPGNRRESRGWNFTLATAFAPFLLRPFLSLAK